jgi:hypothetical protein
LRNPDIRLERNELRRRLREPAKGVEILNLTDVEGVDLKEVYLRGTHRLAPASKKGEELRDVILWLSIIAYASRTRSRVAFVTLDKGFSEGDAVAPKIRDDIATHQVDIQLFQSINDLFRKESPAPISIGADRVGDLIDQRELRHALASAAIETLNESFGGYRSPSYSEANTVLASVRFLEGAQYEAGPEVAFAEIDYGIELVYSEHYEYPPVPPADVWAALAQGPVPSGFLSNLSHTERLHIRGKAQVFARIEHAKVETWEVHKITIELNTYERA